jgi:endonuclease/exonuclease/phosphatase family metal-dependent hydrolase
VLTALTHRAARRRLIVTAMLLAAAGCARVQMDLRPAEAPCRRPAAGVVIRWVAPTDVEQERRLLQWCEAVGPSVAVTSAEQTPDDGRPLLVVSWNMAVGAASVAEMLAYVQRVHLRGTPAHVVVLLQEAYRSGEVPDGCPADTRRARRLGLQRPPAGGDILETARALGMHAFYVPSMRNGRDCREAPFEDRGNAILSTLPLGELTAIELPFARQRRVAVSASIRYRGRAITVASVHFDALRSHRLQAHALRLSRELLKWDGPVIIGGDFNAGPFDRALAQLGRTFREVDCAPGATHTSGWRPDRMFASGLEKPPACRIARERAGSDHHPLVAWIE